MKNLAFVCLLVLYGFGIQAQVLRLGAGISYSKVDWVFRDALLEEQHYSAPVINYAFTAGIEYLRYKNISVTTGILVYRNGGKNTAGENNSQMVFVVPSKVNLDYLSIGTTLNYYPIKKKVVVHLMLGPRFDVLESDLNVAPLSWFNKGDGLNKTNYGLTAGAGIGYTVGDFILGVEGSWLMRSKKLLEVGVHPYSTYPVGSTASEKVMLLTFSCAWKIRQFREE